ncbi:MAG: Mut7-C RNAse domain-containing protein [Candidatus Bipolaricaulis sp.]|nr:Mut7-C RNAse domain-containing protein [Candidatus Bipolaricaulis sp.]
MRVDRWTTPFSASFVFLGSLSDFFFPSAGGPVSYTFHGAPSLKDALEALGVPHVEVDAIVVNGETVAFARPLRDGDSVAVYPHDVAPDGAVLHLQARPPAAPLFVADVHLRRLAKTLRLLGFDVICSPDLTDAAIVQLSHEAGRIVLTRDRQLLKRGTLAYGYWVRSTDPLRQAVEVVQRFALGTRARAFTRCSVCNGLLRTVEKDAVRDRIPPRTALWLDEYHECPDCRRLYWWGTHGARLRALVEFVLDSSAR